MFTVRNIYLEKAKNYFLRQGHAQLSEGGLGHDVIRAVSLYGSMPETAFSGLPQGQKTFNHQQLITDLKSYMDSLIVRNSRGIIEKKWQAKLIRILNTYIGMPPAEFTYDGKQYTAKTFASDYLKFNAKDYVNITSFTDPPYYEPFIISVPDNFSNGAYYNVPLNEMAEVPKNALKNGYTVLWDADVSNPGFSQKSGTAFKTGISSANADSIPPAKEGSYTAETRQALYEDLSTQDDHLMHIIGLEKEKSGKSFFLVKNSWGAAGPYKGYNNVSEAYFSVNTISLVIPKAALSRGMLDKLEIK